MDFICLTVGHQQIWLFIKQADLFRDGFILLCWVMITIQEDDEIQIQSWETSGNNCMDNNETRMLKVRIPLYRLIIFCSNSLLQNSLFQMSHMKIVFWFLSVGWSDTVTRPPVWMECPVPFCGCKGRNPAHLGRCVSEPVYLREPLGQKLKDSIMT